MDTNICVNKVFTDIRSDKQFRLLWIDPHKSDSYVFWLHEKTGVPRSLSIEEIEEGLEKGWLKETEDPFALTREPTAEEKEHTDCESTRTANVPAKFSRKGYLITGY
jgi:hypothetical protein